jgi:hypothetical protein
VRYNWSNLACRIGHLVPILQPLIGSLVHLRPRETFGPQESAALAADAGKRVAAGASRLARELRSVDRLASQLRELRLELDRLDTSIERRLR